ncbi:hypothetical protein M1N18_01255, partial [Dehalococcoidales bacterium]|nr:hypothetical protein [Dehalococcoidales bacterium]
LSLGIEMYHSYKPGFPISIAVAILNPAPWLSTLLTSPKAFHPRALSEAVNLLRANASPLSLSIRIRIVIALIAQKSPPQILLDVPPT